MRWYVFRVTLFLLLVSSSGAFAGDLDFRHVRWGMNRYEVMASETGSPKRVRPNEILYGVALFRRPAHLMYRFYEDRLVGARYVLPLKEGDTLEKIDGLVSLRYGVSQAGEMASRVSVSRVWKLPERTVRLFITKRGQAVIDLSSQGGQEIASREVALLRQRTMDVLIRNF